jgi:hypothetical protein
MLFDATTQMQIMFPCNLIQNFVCWNYFKELHNATHHLDLHKAGFVKDQPQIVVCYGTE